MRRIVGPLLIALCLSGGCQDFGKPRGSPDSSTTYRNSDFELTFAVPAAWAGYAVLHETWESRKYISNLDREVVAATGPVIVLRHPLWKPASPRQDIPVLVFTRAQWEANRQEGIFAGGLVYEIARNRRYVFGIHSRFNTDDSVDGWKEAKGIVDRNTAAAAPEAE